MSIATWAERGYFLIVPFLCPCFSSPNTPKSLECMAGTTGLEPATSAVTVRIETVTH